MNVDLLLDKLIDLEKKEKSKYFSVENINYWPIIRTTYVNYNLSISRFFKKKKEYSILYFVINLKNILGFFFLNTPNIFLAYKDDQSAIFSYKKARLHKQHESLKHSNKIDKKITLIEIGNPLISKTFSKSHDLSLNIALLYTFFSILYHFKKNKIKKYLSKIIDTEFSFPLALKLKIIDNSIEFYIKKEVYRLIFLVKKPQTVFIKSFNNINSFAAIYSANILGIRTVEYQHGQQGSNSLTYSNWNSIPLAGYKMIPKFFWIWEDIFKDKLDKWISKQNYHELQVFKNYWPDVYKTNFSKDYPNKNLKQKFTILYCMQVPEIDQIIIDSMLQLKDIRWYLRLHPRTLDKNYNKIYEQLSHLNIDFDLKYSNFNVFEDVLSKSDILITSWSTTAYESYIFGKKTIIINTIGYNAFKKFIDEGKMDYASSLKQLCQLINQIRNN